MMKAPLDLALDTTIQEPPPGAPGPDDETRPHPPPPPADAAPPRRPERVGSYRILGELARGGMGVVYVGRHERLERLVAIKLLLAEDASAHELERFEIEARAAARLRHPNVVGIHEVGSHEGRPFMVMDLIEGRSLADRLRRDGPLEPREAARLAERLAEALAYAHSRQVLHRDLKPANVLLTPDGEPVLTDFGLARDLARAEGPTVTGQVMGTPSYMPPEQADGRPDRIDRRSDVYSLGATLYALLAGVPPFHGASVPKVLREVLERDPTPLRRLRPEVPADLETICGACLEKDPARRYDSAGALAEDLRRFLADLPIAARRPTLGRRLGTWARRNRALARAVVTTAAAGLALLLASGAAFVVRLRAERDRVAARERIAYEALQALTRDVQERLGEVPGPRARALRQDLLAHALRGLEALRAARAEESTLELETARAEGFVGEVERATGDRAAARASYQRAAAAARRALAHDPVSARGLLVASLVDLARVCLEDQDTAAAQAAAQAAVTEARRLVEATPADGEAEAALGRALALQGRAARIAGRADAAAAALDEAAARLRADDRQRFALVTALQDRGDLHLALGEPGPAAERFEEARGLARALHADAPERPSFGRQAAVAALKQATARQALGDGPAALSGFEEALTGFRALHRSDPGDATLARDVAATLLHIADARRGAGDLARAEGALVEAVDLFEAAAGADDGPGWRADLEVALRNLALVRAQRQDVAGAHAALDRWEAVAASGAPAPDHLHGHRLRGRLLYEEAVAAPERAPDLLPRALAAHRRALDASAADADARHGSGQCLLRLADLATRAGDLARADALLAEAHAIYTGLAAEGDGFAPKNVFAALFQLTGLATAQGRADLAAERAALTVTAGRALLAAEAPDPRDAWNVCQALYQQGRAERARGGVAAAAAALRAAVADLEALAARVPPLARHLDAFRAEAGRLAAEEALLAGRAPRDAREWLLLARAARDTGDLARALDAFTRALDDEALADDPQEGALFDGARCAARLADAQPGARERALGWLARDVALRRELLESVGEELGAELAPEERRALEAAAEALRRHLAQARDEDDLAPLRGDAAFQALWRP
ncbi:MAG: serine/threonine protein kinase [Planctomycetes bacterium]|nr:serine/threonine protein kinase [Planctomycetota bacterium]